MSKSITATVSGVQLQVANDLSTTPEAITDANGTASPLLLSTDNVTVKNGNLGVGTVPEWPLHVGIGQTVKFELTEGAMFVLGPTGVFGIDSVNTAAGRFIVTDGGLVGINNAAPTHTLDVWGTMNVTGQFTNPGIQAAPTPNPGTLATVLVDTKTGILYFQS